MAKKLFHVGSRDVYFTASVYKGVTKVNIRHYSKSDNGELYPLSRGIAMNLDEYQDVKKNIKKVDKIIAEIEKKKKVPKRPNRILSDSEETTNDSDSDNESKKLKKEKAGYVDI